MTSPTPPITPSISRDFIKGRKVSGHSLPSRKQSLAMLNSMASISGSAQRKVSQKVT